MSPRRTPSRRRFVKTTREVYSLRTPPATPIESQIFGSGVKSEDGRRFRMVADLAAHVARISSVSVLRAAGMRDDPRGATDPPIRQRSIVWRAMYAAAIVWDTHVRR